NRISLEGLTEPTRVFEGTAREAARAFPANVNVAAALALAGLGPERTRVEVWADPSLTRNVQSVRIAACSGEAEMTIRNVPSAENPRTGRITALSVIACLRRMTAPMVAGT
ncbi:MAG: aspartate dehydrogenase domain-containing protein, partial [Pseudomonadota bacterium]